MGMRLFYVSVFGFFLGVMRGARFCGFVEFLRVVFGKDGFWVWWFDGEFVVECVAEVDGKQRVFWRPKYATIADFILGRLEN
jgi:hypothetical protein